MIPDAVVDSVSAIHFLGNEIAEQRKEVQGWLPPRDAHVNRDSLTKETHSYSAMHNFRLDNLYPIVEGYQDIDGTLGVAGGVRLSFSDRLGAAEAVTRTADALAPFEAVIWNPSMRVVAPTAAPRTTSVSLAKLGFVSMELGVRPSAPPASAGLSNVVHA